MLQVGFNVGDTDGSVDGLSVGSRVGPSVGQKCSSELKQDSDYLLNFQFGASFILNHFRLKYQTEFHIILGN